MKLPVLFCVCVRVSVCLFMSSLLIFRVLSQAKRISEDIELKNWIAELIRDDGGNVGWLRDNWEAESNKYSLLVKVVKWLK